MPETTKPRNEGDGGGEGWRLRDWLAGVALFAVTAAMVLWQNAHLVVLWDLSYVLDTAVRIAQGQMPYRDFPLAHAPLTFLIQAALMRVTGRVFFHHVLYAAMVGGLGTVAAWRIVLDSLGGCWGAGQRVSGQAGQRVSEPAGQRVSGLAGAWVVSVALAAPLCVLGIYCILPLPSYDCDCAFSILVALLLWQRVKGVPSAFWAGAATCLPMFFKQNIGLPLLATAAAVVLALLAARAVGRWVNEGDCPSAAELGAMLGGMVTALLAAGIVLAATAGVGNYLHWTIAFAAQRRLPGLGAMVGVYADPALVWMLACVAGGLAVLLWAGRRWRWAAVAGVVAMAAPFAWTLASLWLYDDADERGDALLGVWPLLLVLAAALTIWNLRRGLSLRALLPVVVLATVHGTLMSQQLWGSTYAIWPLLVVLVAEMIGFLGSVRRAVALAMTVVVAGTLAVCGGFYMASEERLSYVSLPDGPAVHATERRLAGMATPGPYLPEFEELLKFAGAEIPASDGVILLPGEDPFYFATGRKAQFPVLLFDPATDPFSPAELAAEAGRRGIKWVVVKRDLQIKENPMPEREAGERMLLGDFSLYARLRGYEVYRRR